MRTPLRRPTWRRPLMRSRVVLALVLALALGAAACSAASATRTGTARPGSAGRGRLVDVGGRRLYLECQGTGRPSVVFVTGLGDRGETAWRTVWGQVAHSTRACIYDRAGLGRSDPGPVPASYQGAVQNLHRLLRSGRIQGPYVLVGHSLGGLLARLYTHRHPAEVAGAVLVDATPVDWFPTLQRLLPAALLGLLAHNPEGFDLRRGLAALTALDRPGVLDRRPLAVLWAPTSRLPACPRPPPASWTAAGKPSRRGWDGPRRPAACSASPPAAITSSTTGLTSCWRGSTTYYAPCGATLPRQPDDVASTSEEQT